MKKVCTICKIEKELTEFYSHSKRKDGHQSSCIQCNRERFKKYYEANKEYHQQCVKQNSKKLREERYRVLNTFKDKCLNCNESNPCCLVFHHIDPKEKEIDVSILIARQWHRMLDEIEKCLLLCSNCHMKLHAGRFEINQLMMEQMKTKVEKLKKETNERM